MRPASNLSSAQIDGLAERIDAAQTRGGSLPLPTAEYSGFSVTDAYAVQDALRASWSARGRRMVGYKAGLTSRAKMVQMKVNSPTFGILCADMAVPDGGLCSMDGLSRPRVEPEIALVMKQQFKEPLDDETSVLAAVDYVVPAIEIIDSRYTDYKFDLQSVIADNSSSAHFVIGGKARRASEIDWRTMGILVLRNGEPAGMAASGAVLGNPLRTVVLLWQWLIARGESLPGGSIILTGGVCEAIAVQRGDNVCARFQGLSDVIVRFA
jgi:2-oxo-3-hexenedioate decarboxylase